MEDKLLEVALVRHESLNNRSGDKNITSISEFTFLASLVSAFFKDSRDTCYFEKKLNLSRILFSFFIMSAKILSRKVAVI